MSVIRQLGIVLALSLLAQPAAAQKYPDKPIRVIVPQPAGGNPDLVARMMAPGMANLLGQQLVIDNRSGAGGLVGADLAAKAVPDGYTLFLSGPSFTILPQMMKDATYDAVKDFSPIGLISIGPYLLITHFASPVKSVKELIALAHASPGKLNYSSSGNGSPSHLAMELFKTMAAVDIAHVPYKGIPQAITDLLGGYVNLTFISIPPVLQHIKAGRLRLLGVSTVRRTPQLPDVPTITEAGVSGFEWSTWNGLLAPAKTPKPIVNRLHDALYKVVRTPEFGSQLAAQGADSVGSSPEEFAVFIRTEGDKFGRAIRVSGAKID